MSDSLPPPLPPSGIGQAEAADRVKGPAIALIATAGIGALLAVVGLLMNALGMGMAGLNDLPPEFSQYEGMANLVGGAMGVVSSLLQLVVAGFIGWASLGMMKLERWGVSVAASAVAIIPCLSPCCCLGLPVGIWSLVVLMAPEVKAAFRS